MKPRVIDVLFAILAILMIPLLCISAAALVPCAFRPFYYFFMDALDIPGSSGYPTVIVKEAYDDVMDYIWFGGPFRTGRLAFSEEGEAHFADCVPLFRLQPILFGVSLFLIFLYAFLRRRDVLRPVSPLGQSPLMIGGALTVLSLAFVGVFALVDFDRLFTLFHKIAFPGKENWIFDPTKDEIINILPESFFLACALFIVVSALLLAATAIFVGYRRRR